MGFDKGRLIKLLRNGWRPRPGGAGKRYIVLTKGRENRSVGLKNDEEGQKLLKEIMAEAGINPEEETQEKGEEVKEEAEEKPKEATAKTIVEAAVALPESSKPATPKAEVSVSDAVKPSLDTASYEYNLMLFLGKMVRYELQGDVKITEEELKDPEQAARKYFAFIQTLLKLREDAKAYDRLMAENVVARAAIKELKTAVLQLKEFSDAAWYSMCEPCRKKAMYVLAMKSARAKEVITP